LTLDQNRIKSQQFPESLNKEPEHTQFLGTTAMENQEVENLWNQIFVTPLEEHLLKSLHLFV